MQIEYLKLHISIQNHMLSLTTSYLSNIPLKKYIITTCQDGECQAMKVRDMRKVANGLQIPDALFIRLKLKSLCICQ